MAKRKEDIENPIVMHVIPFKRPTIEEAPKVVDGIRCPACGDRVYDQLDDYVIVDEMYFHDDHCVTDYFIKEAGGRRVHGGAC